MNTYTNASCLDFDQSVINTTTALPQEILSQSHGIKCWDDLNILRSLKLDVGEVIINTAAFSCHFTWISENLKLNTTLRNV